MVIMTAHVVVPGTLKPDGTLELDEKPNLSPGRMRVMLETVTEPGRPERFWAMMEQIWSDLKATGHVPRSAEEIETQRQAFRDEWDERQEALERIRAKTEGPPQQGEGVGQGPTTTPRT
jgi:hypothetical protein